MRLLPLSTPVLVLAATLAGCGPDKNEFAPPCPRPSLVRGLDDMIRFRPGGGKDLTDMVVQGRIAGLGGECRFIERGKTPVEVSVAISAEFQRGPAMQGRQIAVPLFIAVTDNGVVLDKQVMQFQVEFPANVDRIALTSQQLRMVLPTTKDKSPAAFGVVAGFQLMPEEVETNRQRGAAR